jgi:hypothetical protein
MENSSRIMVVKPTNPVKIKILFSITEISILFNDLRILKLNKLQR